MPDNPLFVPPPADPQPIPPRITGTFFGVDIPEDLAFFDCRVADSLRAQITAPWGERFYSRGRLALGLAKGWLSSCGPTPVSITVYFDTRNPDMAQATHNAILSAIRAYRESQVRNDYQLFGIEIENYGFSIIGESKP